MSVYEISPKAAAVIYRALRAYAKYSAPEHTLQDLLEVFAPPEPPTAAELAEALRTALARDYPQADCDALAVLRRWDKVNQ